MFRRSHKMNAFMSDFELQHPRHRFRNEWDGLAEVDRAIAENRITAYRCKKAWADPVARTIGIVVILMILTVWSYLAGAGLGWW